MTEKEDNILKIFYNFLEEQGARSAFDDNILRFSRDLKKILILLLSRGDGRKTEYMVSTAFSWSWTDEGFSYWNGISFQWMTSADCKKCTDIQNYKEEVVIFQENGRNYGQTNVDTTGGL